ncbi:hypothetical protein K4F52_007692 [Lecanicillium sp. MT-2017a]|nr:hypothetical protein K4F52_007692 [Lecanicillium sp. MT-2017a]
MHQSVLSLALLAAAPLAEARFPLRFRGAEQQECCPCPKPGEQPATVTKEITVEPQPSGAPKTVTVVHGKDEPEPQTMATQVIVTKVIEPEQPGPKTVTVTKGQEHQNPDQNPKEPVTVTKGHAQETPAQIPNEPVTVTVQPDQPSRPNEQPSVVTKTIGNDEPMEQGTHTMPGAAVTETPEVKTVTKDADHYTTVTQTVGGQGGDNIEIIIINIITGESSCQKKHSGKPCDSKPESIPCPPVSNSTSTATAFNTILVTVGTGTGTGSGHANTTMPMGTPAYPMGTGNANIMGRYPRPAPIRRKW